MHNDSSVNLVIHF